MKLFGAALVAASAVFVAVGVILCVLVSGAYAHDMAAMTDQKRGDWFNSLKQPGGGASCCNLTDCHETQARQLPDQTWEAIIAGTWRAIPPEKVLKRPTSIDGAAYVCNSPPAPTQGTILIYCFVPPIPGY